MNYNLIVDEITSDSHLESIIIWIFNIPARQKMGRFSFQQLWGHLQDDLVMGVVPGLLELPLCSLCLLPIGGFFVTSL